MLTLFLKVERLSDDDSPTIRLGERPSPNGSFYTREHLFVSHGVLVYRNCRHFSRGRNIDFEIYFTFEKGIGLESSLVTGLDLVESGVDERVDLLGV